MSTIKRGFLKRLLRRQNGAVAVEFAILVPIFLVILFGIIDFGHAWYMRHLMSNASREGARYGTKYWTDTSINNVRLLPKNLVPSIKNYVLNTSNQNNGAGGFGLTGMLPSNANPDVLTGGAGATETLNSNLATEDLSVTVNARKYWWIVSYIPGMTGYVDMSVTTTMKCE